MRISIGRRLSTTIITASVLLLNAAPVYADETCLSPYMAKIVGQEDFAYVWTLGVEGVGDEQDKLVTIDLRPDSDLLAPQALPANRPPAHAGPASSPISSENRHAHSLPESHPDPVALVVRRSVSGLPPKAVPGAV